MLYLQSLKIYITTFLLEVFLVIILVDLSSASSVPEYTDSCSDSSEISLSEVEEGGNSSSDLPIDYGLNGLMCSVTGTELAAGIWMIVSQ